MFCEREAALKNETVLCSAECVCLGGEKIWSNVDREKRVRRNKI